MQRRLEDLWPLLAGLTLACTMQIGIAQVQPSPWQPLQDHFCWKKRVCLGPALSGECQPQGFLCLAGTCGSGCTWSYVWACYEACEETCVHITRIEIGADCGPKCLWLSYNQCVCDCQELGTNTVEGGTYTLCR